MAFDFPREEEGKGVPSATVSREEEGVSKVLIYEKLGTPA
jgi:hypothetical protein